MKLTRALSLTAAAFALAACGGTPPAASDAQVRTAASEKFGTLVTDSSGRTLYRFDKDTAKPPKSNCAGDCATAWPPVIVTTDQVSAQGVDASLVGTVARADGGKQLTVAGWPVYRFAKDAAPGEVKGQGVNGTWFAVTPEGKKAAESSGSGGY